MNKLSKLPPIPMAHPEPLIEEPCCGPPLQPASSHFERPGYGIHSFVQDFIDTAGGAVPVVKIKLTNRDVLGTMRARLGVLRDRYKVAPGLYAVGRPGPDSPVLVTANYKLTFDSLRKELAGINSWILVLDSRGVNVWCAAGKNTFSTQELVRQVQRTGLEKIVTHRRLILPQLGAVGVAGHQVKKACGFEVLWGPIRAYDLKHFLANDFTATPAMREVTFSFAERAVLVPVELALLIKPSLWIMLAVFLMSGIGPEIFSLTAAWQRGQMAVLDYMTGIFAGAVVAPLLLPWLPSRKFYIKGIITGLIAGTGLVWFWHGIESRLEMLALLLLSTAISSYTAMNFTGATPFTSPSGVEKEMRQAIPVQLAMVGCALVLWLAAPFLR